MRVVRNVTPGTLSRIRDSSAIVNPSIARAPHALEHVRRRMLQRQIDVSAHLPALRHCVEHIVGDRGGVEVEQPDPVRPSIASSRRNRPASAPRSPRSMPKKVVSCEMSSSSRTPRPASDRASRTMESAGPAPILAAQRRNDAERAGVVAAFGDLHVGIVARRRQKARGRGVVEIGGQVGVGVRRSALAKSSSRDRDPGSGSESLRSGTMEADTRRRFQGSSDP